MFDKKTIEETMRERGYSKVMEQLKKDELVGITFVLERDDKISSFGLVVPKYSVTVFLEDEEFQFVYSSEKSINKLISPKCSSLMMTEHFDRLVRAFEREASVLYHYNNNYSGGAR